MQSPQRWSGEEGASPKGLPHPGQRGGSIRPIFSQQGPHQDFWGRVPIFWQSAQLRGRHKSTMAEPANLIPHPIEPSTERIKDLATTDAASSSSGARISGFSRLSGRSSSIRHPFEVGRVLDPLPVFRPALNFSIAPINLISTSVGVNGQIWTQGSISIALLVYRVGDRCHCSPQRSFNRQIYSRYC